MKYYNSIKEDIDGNTIKTQEIFTEDGVLSKSIMKKYDENNNIIEEEVLYYCDLSNEIYRSIYINISTNTKQTIYYYKSGYIRQSITESNSTTITIEYDTQGNIINESTSS